jgi:hypothetical protein
MLTYSPLFVYKQERIVRFQRMNQRRNESFIRVDSNMIIKMSSACNSSICFWLGTDHLKLQGGGGGGLWGFFFVQKSFFGQHES